MKRTELRTKKCPIARAGAEIADVWTLIILQEILSGNQRFNCIQDRTNVSPSTLAQRLRLLEDHQILERQQDGTEPTVYSYALSAKGQDIIPILKLLEQWGNKWCGPWGDAALIDQCD